MLRDFVFLFPPKVIYMKKSLIWFILFTILFMLSQDFWFWDLPVNLGILGLPTWLYWFFGIHLLLILVIYLFTRHFWKSK